MHVNSPGRLTSQENSTSTAAIPAAKKNSLETKVKDTQQVSFSTTHKSNASSTSASHSTQSPALVKDLQGKSIFSKNAFSPEFIDAYCAARIAIDSDENRYYENHLGWLSPNAESAVKKLAAVVANKSGATQSSQAARTAFNLVPLTVNEQNEWNALAEKLPPVYKSYLPTCSPWRTLEKNEAIAALSRDAAMADMLFASLHYA